MTPTDEKILHIQQDILRIQCNLFRLMTDVESLAADILQFETMRQGLSLKGLSDIIVNRKVENYF
eukprot:scaffold4891_cov28-Attheya_sp.AAC.4